MCDSTTLEASGKLFSHVRQIQLLIQNTKDKAALSAPCVAGCLLPNLRPLKGQCNERHGFRGQLTNVKPPSHMKGERVNPRRPPLSSLTADLSKLGQSPPPWHVWNADYVLGNWKQCGEGNGGQVAQKAPSTCISCRKHLILSRPAPNAPSDTADKWFLIRKHAVGVWKHNYLISI